MIKSIVFRDFRVPVSLQTKLSALLAFCQYIPLECIICPIMGTHVASMQGKQGNIVTVKKNTQTLKIASEQETGH